MDLTEERWQLVVDVFTAAAELPSDQQESFVRSKTAGDPELWRQVTGMLAHAPAAAERIAKSIETIANAARHGDDWIGRCFGPYRIVREIGRGGMGLVFEAVRDDDHYRKTVALKIAPNRHDMEGLRERFRHERQILAELEHPNIARFLDGGADDGVPYFAMEYVEGIPITEYCQARRLPVRARVELFRQACAAVHHAHESLVIHRDLKPANILVGTNAATSAQVKLLDFGIAKLLSPLSPVDTASTGSLLWTPDYASPEQVRGRAVTTRTDVYSLGLILYELLTGERAQVADTSSPLALDRSICETEPPRASERAMDRRLRGELDAIVAMAIRKEPQRRYGSAAELSEDLRRYLAREPVAARPNTISYRTGRFLRRHRLGVAAGILVIASIAAGVVSTLHQAQRADRRFDQVRQLANTLIFEMHDGIANNGSPTEARKTIIGTSLRYLESLRQEAAGDRALLRELASAYEKIGDVQWRRVASHLGDTRGALESYRTAEGILTGLGNEQDESAERQLGWIYLRLGQVRKAMGASKASKENYFQAQAITRKLLKQSPNDSGSLDLAIELHANMTGAFSEEGDASAASKTAGEAMGFARRLVDLDPGNRLFRSNLGAAHYSLAIVNTTGGKWEEAAAHYRAAVAINERLVREQPNSVLDRTALIECYGGLGDILGARPGQNLGDVTGAVAAFEAAVEVARSLSRNDPGDRKALFDLARAQLRLGSLLAEDLNSSKQALAMLEESRGIVAQLIAEDSNNVDYRLTAIRLGGRLGDLLGRIGKTQQAVRHIEVARTAAAELLRGGDRRVHSNSILLTVQLADLYSRIGDERAIVLGDAAAREIDRVSKAPIASWTDALAYRDLGLVYLRASRRHEAARWLARSAQCWRELHPPPALESQRKMRLTAVEAELLRSRARL